MIPFAYSEVAYAEAMTALQRHMRERARKEITLPKSQYQFDDDGGSTPPAPQELAK